MAKFIIVVITYLMSVVCHAQVSETRPLTKFSKVEVETGIELVFTESNSPSLVVMADDSQKLQRIITKVEGNTLKIYVKSERNKHSNFKVLKVKVSQSNVNSFQADSGASISFANTINVSKATISIDSGAMFNGNIAAEEVKLVVNSGASYKGNILATSVAGNFDSGAKIKLSGKSKTAIIKIDSAAILEAIDFTTAVATIDAESMAKVSITVTDLLEARASSMANIKYYGATKKVNAHADSLARIEKKQ
jgi:hypothetical protein